MSDIRNIELKIKDKVVTSATSALNVGGQVPANMKRWFTFVSLDTVVAAGGASQIGVYLASVSVSNPTKASLIATGNRKLLLYLRATGVAGLKKAPVQVPKVPNINTPLFSIAGGKWLGVWATKTTGTLKTQYFDE